MKNWIVAFLLFAAIFLESSFISFPFTFLFLLVLTITAKKQWIFAVSFLSGVLLDLLRLETLGQTSLFFVIFFFIVLLYDKKFDIQTYPFVLISSFLGSLLYLLILGSLFLEQAIASSLMAILLFKGVRFFGFIPERQTL